MLEDAGHQVISASNGRAALKLVENKPKIDLLVTDVVMPDVTGPQLAERMAAVRPEMKVLYMSGYRRENLGRHGLDRDANLLSKPFPPSELLRRVRLLLGQAAAETR